jgi:hypothetical protein
LPGDLSAIRNGLAANLAPIAVADTTVTVSAYVISDPKPPVIWIRPTADTLISYHAAMQNGVERWLLTIEAFAGALADLAAQQRLDAFVSSAGSVSVKAAAESDRTLGGACQTLQVLECHNYAEYSRPDGGTLLSAIWDVEILA